MADRETERRKTEQEALDQIAGREGDAAGSAPKAAAPAKSRSLGWMDYVGGVLWLTVLAGAGAAGWLFFAGGA